MTLLWALTLSLKNTALEDRTTTSSDTVHVCLCLAINANLPSQVLLVMDKITQETFILKVSGMCVCVCVCNVRARVRGYTPYPRRPDCKCEVCQKPLCVTGVIDSNGPVPVSSSALRCETCARCQRTARAQMTTHTCTQPHTYLHTLVANVNFTCSADRYVWLC